MLTTPKDRSILMTLLFELAKLERGPVLEWLKSERDRIRLVNETEMSEAKFRQTQGVLRALTAQIKFIESARETLKVLK